VQVYISKNDQQWGPFDLDQLERLKAEGALKASDWAWEQGESAWVPLGEILERHGKRLPVWRPAVAQRRTWNFYAPVAVGVVCVLLLITLGWPTVVDADRIVVIEHGAVVEEGTHHDLLEANGKYAELWRIQREQQG